MPFLATSRRRSREPAIGSVRSSIGLSGTRTSVLPTTPPRRCADEGARKDVSLRRTHNRRVGGDSAGAGHRHPAQVCHVSAILRPSREALPLVTIAAGVAVAEGVQAASGLNPCVKWPNDVYVGVRKLAGILAEGGRHAAGADHVVVGFGINLRPAAFPPDVAARATSIESELGRGVDRGLVLAECLAALATRYHALESGASEAVITAWRARAAEHLGRSVEWDAGRGRFAAPPMTSTRVARCWCAWTTRLFV